MANTAGEIVGLLRESRDLRARQKAVRAELIRIAIEVCGLSQQDAMNMDIYAYLDGYAQGQGLIPPHRLERQMEQAA